LLSAGKKIKNKINMLKNKKQNKNKQEKNKKQNKKTNHIHFIFNLIKQRKK